MKDRRSPIRSYPAIPKTLQIPVLTALWAAVGPEARARARERREAQGARLAYGVARDCQGVLGLGNRTAAVCTLLPANCGTRSECVAYLGGYGLSKAINFNRLHLRRLW